MPPIGVAVITYNRVEWAARAIDSVRRLTRSPYELVVADDGSDDPTVEWCQARGIRIVTGRSRGVAWNKNRGLFALSLLGCDPLLIVEDDVYPAVPAWDDDWVQATRRWHHVAFLDPKLAAHSLAGSGTAADPYLSSWMSPQCQSVSAQALGDVGFFDSRFAGRGHEHEEWTIRLWRAGHGHREVVLADGTTVGGLVGITDGLATDSGPSDRDPDEERANLATLRRITGEPVFRHPWCDPEAQAEFLSEQEQAGLELATVRP